MNKPSRLMPLFLVMAANLLGFLIIFNIKENVDFGSFALAMGLVAALLLTYIMILFFPLGDQYLFLIVAMLLTIGIITLFRLETSFAKHQLIGFYVGMIGFFAVFLIYRSFRFWEKIGWLYLCLSLFLFILTLVFGESIYGARNWLVFKGVSIQPAEIIKILFILALAAMYSAPYKKDAKGRFGRIYNDELGRQAIIMGAVYIHLAFLVLQRDWGLALLYFLVYFSMQYVFGNKPLILLLNIVLAFFGSLAGFFITPHIQSRVASWQNPFADPGDMGYQIIQSMYAMASGGFTGTGLGLGRPDLIPVVKSDFIFSAICEELGMLGGTAIIMLFFILIYRGVKISLRVLRPFNKAVALGLSVMFGFQTFIIIGGVIKFIPLTGITLPFISAGGSSLVTSFAALGILQAISSKSGELSDEI